MSYHQPVLLQESLEGLKLQAEGIYVDVTFGGGGHSQAIIAQLTSGKLLSFDQDADAWPNAQQFPPEKFTLVKDNFRNLDNQLQGHHLTQIDGLLADLGVSSHQFDTPSRGFSTRFEADLDMRMDQGQTVSAANVLNTYSEKELQKIFSLYGEVTNARTLAQKIVQERYINPFKTTTQLITLLNTLAPRKQEFKYQAQVFQALRIEVNDEIKALEEMLLQTAKVIKTGGRLVVISYHSLEDRLVKNWMQTGNLQGELTKDFYGNVIKPFQMLTRKPVLPSSQEITRNPRARSAKLRIAQKL